MSEKRFIFATNEKWFLFDNETEDYMDMEDCKDKLNELSEENEQLRQQLQEYKENWDDMVELATKTSLRNVELDEQIGRLQRENEQLKTVMENV